VEKHRDRVSTGLKSERIEEVGKSCGILLVVEENDILFK